MHGGSKPKHPERNELIIQYWCRGYIYDDIARYMHVSRGVVAGVIDRYKKRMGLKIK